MTFPKIEPLESRIAPATISISNPTVSINESQAGTTTADFTVTLSAPAPAGGATVHFKTRDGSAISSGQFADYDAQEDDLTFAAGDTSKTISITVTDDVFKESSQNFTVELSNPSTGNTLGTATGTATILDNDSDAVITIGDAPNVTEGDGITSVFTLTLSHAVEKDVTVNFATGDANDTAKPAPGSFTDYISKTGTVTFAAGTTSQTIPIQITNDIYRESIEQFTVKLSSPANAVLDPDTSAVGRILNDSGDTSVGLAIANPQPQREGDLQDNAPVETNVPVTLFLSDKLTSDLAVKISTQNGTAVGGDNGDFRALTDEVVTVTAQTLSKNFNVTLLGDTTFESTESFFVNITEASGVTVANDNPVSSTVKASARVYILNDDRRSVGTHIAQWVDVDGDLVTMTITKGDVNLAGLFSFGNVNSLGGSQLQEIHLDALTFGSTFAGTNITITATKQPGFPGISDGKVDVGAITAATFNSSELQSFGVDLGTVTVDGDLARITAGDSFSTPAIVKLAVDSLGVHGATTLPDDDSNSSTPPSLESRILGPIGTVDIKGDLAGFLHVIGAEFGTVGTLKIGGALKGGTADSSGAIQVSGRLNNAILGSILGSSGANSGDIFANFPTSSIGTLTVTGKIMGGSGKDSGQITATRIGNVTIGGLVGGSAEASGVIQSTNTFGNLTVKGDVVGGSGKDTGEIIAGTAMGVVKVTGKVAGGGGLNSGSIRTSGNIASVTIDGSLEGAAGATSGTIQSTTGNLGPIIIKGKMIGNTGDDSGSVLADLGSITSVTVGSIAPPTVGNTVKGGDGKGSGTIRAGADKTGTVPSGAIGNIGTISLLGENSLTGGAGQNSGAILASGKVTSFTTSGDIAGGSGAGSGGMLVKSLQTAIIHGELAGGTGVGSGTIQAGTTIGSVTIDTNLRGGTGNGSGGIVAIGAIGTILIKDDVVGADSDGTHFLNRSGFIAAQQLKSVTIEGSLLAGKDIGGGSASSGSIRADTIDSLLVKGSIIGQKQNDDAHPERYNPVVISAKFAIKNLTVGISNTTGNVRFAEILAGYSEAGTSASIYRGTAASADASIGNVVIRGAVRALNIVASADPGTDNPNDAFGPRFGTADDKVVAPPSSNPNNPALVSKIASIVIGTVEANPGGAYGIVAQQIGTIKIGTTAVVLTPGAFNDTPPKLVAPGTNFFALEVGLT